ncbi:MAG: ABC transporter substrate-binding protein [Sedimentisphaerales bacterium]|nr:ABC transporter substrate-binding protein [Sedimentisphaerales bacterium]
MSPQPRHNSQQHPARPIRQILLAAVVLVFAAVVFGLYSLRGYLQSRPAEQKQQDVQLAETASLRIVSLAPNLTEILYAMGLDKEIVAVTSDSNFPEQAQFLPRVGTFWQPDMEAIIAARPTLVAALGFDQQAGLAGRLQKMGCRALSLNIESFTELYSGIQTLGQSVNHPQEAGQLMRRIQGTQDNLRQRFAGRAEPRVLWVIQREPLRVAGVDTFVDEMIRTCGGRNAIGKTIHQYPPISQETLLATAPEIIIEPADTQADYERLSHTINEFYGRYPSLPAVQEKRIYVLDGDLVSRLGPRIEHGLKEVARCLWPQENFN